MPVLQFPVRKDKLYEEMQTHSLGTKTAKPNISLWVALMYNPIMGTILQEILLTLNCSVSSYTGLQRNGSKVVWCGDCERYVTWNNETKVHSGKMRIPTSHINASWTLLCFVTGVHSNLQYRVLTPQAKIRMKKKHIRVAAKNKLCRKRKVESKCPEHPGKC